MRILHIVLLVIVLTLSSISATSADSIYLPIIKTPLQFTWELQDSGTLIVITNRPSYHSACIQREWGCEPSDQDSEFLAYEDGGVRFWLDSFQYVSVCAFPDLGCS